MIADPLSWKACLTLLVRALYVCGSRKQLLGTVTSHSPTLPPKALIGEGCARRDDQELGLRAQFALPLPWGGKEGRRWSVRGVMVCVVFAADGGRMRVDARVALSGCTDCPEQVSQTGET
ncbi:hypothetical protein HO173_002522 [Letharia columbiana]|uniref:Secreted protein n=1 Tax=Letharia columbiana TaxID=112416 RepID=A0A8H6L870_9LECA|nr:uncharacterized protein HO173_002522 [Letharia columbiana]KAF6239261.1 hypothetical protein HO173_002522 [Letharia columbiana]